MKNRILYFALVLISGLATAQTERTIVLRGKILNDTIERANVSVVNLSLKVGAITNNQGQFKIEARLQDTIHLSAVQYETFQFVVSAKMIARGNTAFYLVPKITELGEVQLSNSELTGNLSADILPFDTNSIYDAKRGNLPQNTAPQRTAEERKLYTASTRGPDQVGRYNARFDIPLLGVINGLSGKTKQLKKRIAIANFQAEVDRQRLRFSDTVYIKTMQIPLVLIDDFVLYAMSDAKEVSKIQMNSLIELFAYFEKKAKTYLVLKAQELDEENEVPIMKQ
ncbi:MAG: hypothetical protein ACI828_001187 [Flavobacteriales bacterium]|jgi:hypothetical protein